MSKLGFSAFATHPGEVIKDELTARNISQRSFAKVLNMSYSVLNEILNARRPVTVKTALMFEAALDIPAYSLLQIQTKYSLQHASCDKETTSWLSQIRHAAAML